MPKSMTVAAAEGILQRLGVDAGRLRIPTKGRHHQAGGEAAMTQALVTWAQRKAKGEAVLETYVNDADDPEGQLRTLTRQLFGLTAALVCDEALDRSGTDQAEPLRSAALQRLTVIQSERPRAASRGPQYEVVCADHLGRSAPTLLYRRTRDGEAELRDAPAFDELARQIAKTVIPEALADVLPAHFTSSMGAALHELFRNTEEHARVDARGHRLTRSIRAIQARRHDILPHALTDIVSQSQPLAAYVGRLVPPRETSKQVRLLEFSILDSGPGLAAALARSTRPGSDATTISLEDEQELVLECFRKHASSKRESNAGLGLSNVVDILRSNDGFLRVRTGRQALFADLGLEQGASFETPPCLRRWSTDRADAPPVAGTLVTLLVPLVHER